jgi:plasmid stability protein
MTRITITLPEPLAAILAREAERTGRSVSEVVRTVLAKGLGVGEEARPIPFAGVGRSGHRDTARRAEEILEREWGGDRDR